MRFAFSASAADIETVNIPMSQKSQINANLYYNFPAEILGGNLDFNADYSLAGKGFRHQFHHPWI